MMQYKRFGKSTLSTSRIALGSWIGFSKETINKEKAKLFEYAYQRGINHFDTASNYGGREAELIIGNSLEFVPKDDIILATKYFWPLTTDNPETLLGQSVASIKRIHNGITYSLKKLRVQSLDIVYINSWKDTDNMQETVIALKRELNRGRILYYGLSNFTKEQLTRWLNVAEKHGLEDPVVIQMPFSVMNRKPVFDILEIIQKKNIGLMVFQVLHGGILSGKYKDLSRENFPKDSRLAKFDAFADSYFNEGKKEDSDVFVNWAISEGLNPAEAAISWVLRKSFVTGVIAGVQTEGQLESWISALQLELTSAQTIAIDNLFGPNKVN